MSLPDAPAPPTAPPEYPDPTPADADIEAIFASVFWFSMKAPPELLKQYEGKHVAILGERIIDGDRDFDALARRIEARGDATPVSRLLFRFVPTDRPDVIAVASALLTNASTSADDAQAILRELADYFGTEPEDGMYSKPRAPLNRLVRNINRSPWGELLRQDILGRFTERPADKRPALGGLYGYLTGYPRGSRKGPKFALWCWDRVDELCDATGRDAVAAALRLWPTANYGFPKRQRLVRRLVRRLFDMLGDGPSAAHAAADILCYLQNQLEEGRFRRRGVWEPTPPEVERLVQFLLDPGVEPGGGGRFVMGVVIEHPQGVGMARLVERLRSGDAALRECLRIASGWAPDDEDTLKEVLDCLAGGRSAKTIPALPISKSPRERIEWSQDGDGMQPWREQPEPARRPDDTRRGQQFQPDRKHDPTAAAA